MTYQEELEVIKSRFIKKYNGALDRKEKLPGLDDTSNIMIAKAKKEYNEELLAVKEKYGIED